VAAVTKRLKRPRDPIQLGKLIVDIALARILPLYRVFILALCTFPFPVSSETVEMEQRGKLYAVPVRLNDTITLPFLIDTGATNVVITSDVVSTLMRIGTVSVGDFIGAGTAVLADGTEIPSLQFVLHHLQVGNHVVRNVVASVTSERGESLLGQSFLSKLPAWAIDNHRQLLVLSDRPSAPEAHQSALTTRPESPEEPRSTSQPTPKTAGADAALSVGELTARATSAFAKQDFANGAQWCRIASEKGSALGMRCIGSVYAKGLGVPVDYGEAMKWYRRAAETGDPSSMYALAVLDDEGKLVAQDFSEALYWYQKAAAQGDADAESNIGVLYMNGQGVPQDYAEAMRWFRMAASQRNATAQNNIGVLYQHGWGVSLNYAEAMRWFRMAADQGNAPALNNIGLMVAHGEGVGKDCAVARQWLERATATGFEPARNSLRNGVDGVCHWM
jgi:clan AA aspartic protease (TIGR02281 family)